MTDMETVKVLNTFFSNVVQNLNISRFLDSDPYEISKTQLSKLF